LTAASALDQLKKEQKKRYAQMLADLNEMHTNFFTAQAIRKTLDHNAFDSKLQLALASVLLGLTRLNMQQIKARTGLRAKFAWLR
jgi:hypothetical protein